MTRDGFIEFALTLQGAKADCPFEESEGKDYLVLRHSGTGKWFALLMTLDGKDAVNLKCEPMNADLMRKVYKGVVPAYHMNKTHWNTVFLDSDVPEEEIKNMLDISFALTGKKKGKSRNGKV